MNPVAQQHPGYYVRAYPEGHTPLVASTVLAGHDSCVH